jgi:N-acetylglucosamine kinase-like BadF-type ATPase
LPDRLYLGVDGGQSSTTAFIANEHGRILGRGVGGPCNHASAVEGRRKFLSAVGDCLRQACEEAGLSTDTVRFSATCFGLSGGAEDKAAFIYELVRSEKYKLTHDGEIALTGATGGAPGIIIIAGTGSFAFGRNASGVTGRSGGWGYIYGDEGGAFDLTRRALRAALRQEEGWGPETLLRQLLLQATGTTSADQLLHQFYADVPRSTVATYAPLVTRAAQDGDAVASSILEEAASALCGYVRGVYRQLFGPDDAPRVSHIGGVFQSQLLLHRFATEVRKTISPDFGPPLYPPVLGAVLEAFGLDGVKAVPDVP